MAEAVLRVFKRLGDYQHKQRNRMKFMIRELGWTRWREEYDRELTACRLQGDVPTLDIDPPAAESKPDWVQGLVAVGRRHRLARGGRTHHRTRPDARDRAGLRAGRRGVRAVARDERASAEAVRVRDGRGHRAARRSDERADARARRAVARVRRRHGARDARTGSASSAGSTRATCGQLYRRLAAAGLGLAEAGTVADVTSCPGAETCRLAVTQSRGLGRLLEDHLRARPDLIAAADGARIKISGCPNGCGLHHIATIGFQGSVRRLGSRAVPQYFVMVGGGATDGGRRFGRLAAKIPARRIPEAVERLIDLYASEKQAGRVRDGVLRARRRSSG